MKSTPTGLVAPAREGASWTGDGHVIRLEAGEEVGLSRREVGLESFREGFTQGVELFGEDAALVLHGRTILSRAQLRVETRELMEAMGIPQRGVIVRVDDGQFELRIARWVVAMVGVTRPLGGRGGGAVGVAAGLTAAGLALGMSGIPLGVPGALAVLAGAGILWTVRVTKARGLLARRLTEELGRLAQREGTVLPPSEGPRG